MSLRYASAPNNGASLVRDSLNRLTLRKSPLSDLGVDISSLPIQQPHAVYDLRADEVAAGKALSSARATGFRYLIGPTGTPAAAAEVITDGAGAAQIVANINYGPFVSSSARALQAIPDISETQAGSYEVRLLRFSAIGVVALWLKADVGGTDILYPLAPVPSVLQAEKPYTPQDFFAAIMPMAERRAQSHGPLVP
jgi:hypothetical protein